jgi:hypothetical protein
VCRMITVPDCQTKKTTYPALSTTRRVDSCASKCGFFKSSELKDDSRLANMMLYCDRTGHMLSIGEYLARVMLTTHRLLPLKFRSANYIVMTLRLKG